MATSNNRDVRLGIQIETTGEEGIKRTAGAVRDLGTAGAALPEAFAETSAAIERLSAKTRELREVEGAARAELKAATTAQATHRDELARLSASTDSTAKKTTEYKEAARLLNLALIESRAPLRDKRQALTDASNAARTAATAEAALKAELRDATTAYRQAGAAAATAGQQQVVSNEAARNSLAGIGAQLRTIQQAAAAVVGGQLLGGLIGDIGRTADAYVNLSARTKLATTSNTEFQATFADLFAVAQRTGATVDTIGAGFTKLAQAGKEIGLNAAGALQLTETLTQAIQLSGASAQEAQSAVLQLGQAIGSGKLAGDELRSILENAPRLAKALADGLGVAVGKLKAMGEAGELTSARVVAALQGQSAALQREFETLPPTIGRAINNISTAWTQYIGEASAATGASATAAKAIDAVAKNLDVLAGLLIGAGKAAIAFKAVRLAQEFLSVSTAAKVATVETVAFTTAQTAANAASAGTAATVGRFASLLGTLKLLSLVGVLTNLREIGTAIGEGAAKLMGWGKAIEQLEIAQRADADAARANAASTAAVAQAMQLAADKAFGLTDQSRKLVGEFIDVTSKGGEVSSALEKLTKNLELGNLDGIRNAGIALDDLARKGLISGAAIRDSLATALKNEDLAVFRINAQAAFDQSEQGARRLAAAIDAIATESLRRAGTSLQELTTGFSAGATSAINDLDALAKTLKDLKLTGDDAGRVLGTALDKALSAAHTERAVQAVIDRLEDLGKQGAITGEQLADGLDRARKKIDELKPGINSLSEALSTFGLQTREQLQATADKLGKAYDQIGNSARVSLADQRKAFDQWSAAAIAANGGVESSAVKVARTMLEVKEAALGAGAAGAAAGKQISEGFDGARRSIDAAAGSLGGFNDAATTARNAAIGAENDAERAAADKNGNFSTDANGNRISVDGQVKIGDGQFFDKAAFDRANTAYLNSVRGLTGGTSGFKPPDPQRFVKDSPVEGQQTPQQIIATEQARLAGIKAQNPSNSASGGNSFGTVNIVINGKSTPVKVASRTDAELLAGLMRELESVARVTYPR